jgi:hypothetical protein
MMTTSTLCKHIFAAAIADYHRYDSVNQPIQNPYPEKTFEYYLYLKSWIDTVQWHLEDIIRDTEIAPEKALEIKRIIDRSNQERTDLVELIDGYFMSRYSEVQVLQDATLNTESPAWAIDRLSILQLKIYHWEIETLRTDVTEKHTINAKDKLAVLKAQQTDLSQSIDELLTDISLGKKRMKVYKQMKMYNDPELNPVLYVNKSSKS